MHIGVRIRRAAAGAAIAVLALLPGCRGEGFLGCDNVLAFDADGTVFQAVLFNNRLLRAFDPYTGVEFKILVIEAESEEGELFRLEITDYRDGAFGNCITAEPYFADPGLNYCVPGTPNCNRYTARYFPNPGGEYVSAGPVGQVVVASCDTDGRISGSFDFDMEDFSAGGAIQVTLGSFSLCYLIP